MEMTFNAKVNTHNPHVDVKIYQVYYDITQRPYLDPAFVPYDNTANLRPKECEYWIFYNVFEQRQHLMADYLGMLSWKFQQKTNITGKIFIDCIRNNPGYDVYFVNPFPAKAYQYYNVWYEGERHYPLLIRITQQLLRNAGYKHIDLASMRNTPQTTAFCNYWAGNAEFWRKYMEFTLPLYRYIQTKATENERNILMNMKVDVVSEFPLFPYLFERLFSTLLAYDTTIHSYAIPVNIDLMPNKPVNRAVRSLINFYDRHGINNRIVDAGSRAFWWVKKHRREEKDYSQAFKQQIENMLE